MRHSSAPFALLLLAACGGGGGAPPSDAGIDSAAQDDAATDADADPEPEPRILFLAPADPAPVPVTSILYGRLSWVRVEGLAPGVDATLRSRLWGYHGWARFVAGTDGTIDTARDAPEGGTYEGVEPEGLVWSMVLESDAPEDHFDVTVDLELDGAVVTSAKLERRPLDDGLVREELDEDGLVGVLYRPSSAGPHPAVLVVGGSEGGVPERSASLHASFGVAALALGYFGAEGLPSALTEIPLETFGAALDWLARHPELDPDRIAVAGNSRGGELALQISALHPEVVGTLAVVPSGVRWGSAASFTRSAWTLGGESLPYVHVDESEWADVTEEWLPNGNRAIRMSPVYLAILEGTTPEELAAATIDVERASGPVLLVGGADDGLWPSCALAQIALDRLVETGHRDVHGDELLCFPDAGHFIGPPGWPTAETYALRPPFPGPWWVLGGTPAGTGHAQRELFDATRAFWGAAFGMELQ